MPDPTTPAPAAAPKDAYAGKLADGIIAAYESPEGKAKALALIAAGEGGIQAALTKALQNAPRPPGLLGTLWPLVETELASYAGTMIADFGPGVIFTFLDHQLRVEAKALGG